MKQGYEGKISNKGTQHVKAPYPQTKGPSSNVKKGDDLRSK